jgi:hypothetical protein
MNLSSSANSSSKLLKKLFEVIVFVVALSEANKSSFQSGPHIYVTPL